MAEQENNSVSAGKLLYVDDFLQISFVGFQSGFGVRPDLILFLGPTGATLAIPTNTMHEPRERARQIVQAEIEGSSDAYNHSIDSESMQAIDRFSRSNSPAMKAVSETTIGRAIAKRTAEAVA